MTEEYGGPERREGYAELAAKLDQHVAEIELRFSRWFRAGLAIVAVIGLTSTIALIGFGYALREIQQQRRDVCESQNRRHDSTLKAVESAKFRTPETKQVTIKLINSLVPVQDCKKSVKSPLK